MNKFEAKNNSVNSPRFEEINGSLTLIVDNQPFIAYAGEIHNSNASNPKRMKDLVWDKIDTLNLNTLLVPVYWENIEKIEGTYDFENVKAIIDQARTHNIKLIFLWFGLWKNGISTYIPKWMKKDRKNYPFAKHKDGSSIYSISPLCTKAIQKDADAFHELMKFIKKYDENQQTVIMIQIENEIGLLGTDFDYSEKAMKGLNTEVPDVIRKYCGKQGVWKDIFFNDAKEMYLAYHYAEAIQKIAERGKEAYDIPFFINAWIAKEPTKPGEYPTGGPISKQIPLYKYIAKDIIAFAPDIYVPNFVDVCEEYIEHQEVLLIPETRQDKMNVGSNLIYSVGAYNLYCYSPFAIEDFKGADERDSTLLKSLSIDADAFNPQHSLELFSKTNKLLSSMTQLIVKNRNLGNTHAFIKECEGQRGELIQLKNCNVKIKYPKLSTADVKPAGFLLEVDEYEFYLVGLNYQVILESDFNQIGIISLEEGYFFDNQWVVEKVLNGDEQYYISFDDTPKVLRIEYHVYS